MKHPRVQVLYFAACPSYQHVYELVEKTLAELGLSSQVELIEVTDADRAAELRFLGSPTVRVDGHDVEPGADEREDYAFACRVYRTERGFSETPDPVWVREALEAAVRR